MTDSRPTTVAADAFGIALTTVGFVALLVFLADPSLPVAGVTAGGITAGYAVTSRSVTP